MEFNGTIGEPCEPASPGRQVFLDEMPGGARNGDCIQDPLIPDFGSKPYEIYCGDALETIRRIKAGGTQFDCVITSPPYLKQRRYGDSPKEVGQEKDVRTFISSLVGLFRETPLRPWASVWVNLGDKRSGDGALFGVPHLFVAAMLNAGFFLKDDVVWAKEVVPVEGKSLGHCQVEPAPGRLNGNGWEPFYRFVNNPKRAWSDTSAVRIPRDPERFFHEGTDAKVEQHPYSANMKCVTSIEGCNLTNAWHVGNARKGKNHHAAFPSELIDRPIAMTCPEWLVNDAGEVKPRQRIVEQTIYSEGQGKFMTVYGQFSRWQEPHMHESTAADEESGRLEALREKSGRNDSARQYVPRYPKTVGWTHEDKPLVGAGIVFDPFGGTGTVGEIAVLLGRRFVGIDLYQEYADRMAERCEEAYRRLSQAREAAPVLV
jgi:DNA modification methylase